ncbi:AAA family ATPase [Sphingobium phenoxybenzoativorans]|uniref:AAA family ATPase n=1 Tax=Sphingobium phenoxybenzoativorans TaxID=1592790 RepID=UPI0009F2D9DA|nr:AAA family ATPase [Sphingobium phenoxybenzoativorans]
MTDNEDANENTEGPAILKEIAVPGIEGTLPVAIGRPTFILGRNGTGKSALVHRLVSEMAPDVVYLPGSRPAYFDQEGLTMTAAARRQYDQNRDHWDRQLETRYRPVSGTNRNEKAVFDLQAKEAQYSLDATADIKLHGRESSAIDRLMLRDSPLEKANQLFEQGNLPIRLKMVTGEMMATRSASNPYGIVKMSDGERSAMILAAEVISAKPGSVFLIDEPELHLHRSIVVPLLVSLMSERQDCAFIISTHELSLPTEIENAQALLVRGCIWTEAGTVVGWDANLLPSIEEVPEDIRIDILGSRRRILFVEGVQSSLDQPLYEILFPEVSVRSRNNCVEVQKAVAGLRMVEALHHIDAYGLVDNDSQTAEKIASLADSNIYALPAYSVESLYYSDEVMAAIAVRQVLGSEANPTALLENAKIKALESLKEADIKLLAGMVSAQHVRQAIISCAPDRHALVANGDAPLNITIDSPYPAEAARLSALIEAKDLAGIVRRYPIRRTQILTRLATGLRFKNRSEYENAALTQIAADPSIASAVRSKLGTLASVLMPPVVKAIELAEIEDA